MQDQVYVFRRDEFVNCDAEVVVGRPWEPIICPAEPDHRNSWRPPGPITIDLEESGRTECLWTLMSDCLLGEAVIDELQGNRVTGFATNGVRTVGHSPSGINYSQFSAIGWGGIAPESSGIHVVEGCRHCGYKRYSPPLHMDKLFDELRWDGSDVFMIWPMTKFIFVVQRVKDILDELGVSGLKLLPIEELKLKGYGFAAHRLKYHFPADRAAQIAGAVGLD
jgi:hypothetical protein